MNASETLALADAASYLRHAVALLNWARLRLDDGDFYCQALDDLYGDAVALLALWAGRPVPLPEPLEETFPERIAASAREWRRRNGRSY